MKSSWIFLQWDRVEGLGGWGRGWGCEDQHRGWVIALQQLQCSRTCPHICVFVTELPSPPLSLAVEEVSENSITLTWKAPEQTGQSGLDGYVVEICKDGSRLGLSCLISVES